MFRNVKLVFLQEKWNFIAKTLFEKAGDDYLSL